MVEDPGPTELPLPAPCLWGCPECVRLLLALADAWADDCFWEQLQTARHIVEAHPECVPAQHLNRCKLCPQYASRADDDAARVWAQHRARDLFMPPEVARML